MNQKEALLNIRNLIKSARIGWKITKSELSRRTGISVYLITKIESGENVDIHRICRLLPALYLRSEILIEVGLIENFDEYHDENRKPVIELDRTGGIFTGFDKSQIIVDWKSGVKGIK